MHRAAASIILALVTGAMIVSACGGSNHKSATATNSANYTVTTETDTPEAASTPTADQNAVVAVIRQQLILTSQKDWRALYDSYSPRVQTACAYDKFAAKRAASDAASSQFDLSKVSFERLRVRVSGDEARVSYVLKYNGNVVSTVGTGDPDVYVRIDGKWYDEADTHSPTDC